MKKIVLLSLLLLGLNSVFAVSDLTISNIIVSDPVINSGGSGSLSFVVSNDGDREFAGVNIYLTSGLSLSQEHFFFSDFDQGES